MVFFNYALRKLNAKIVYYGPGLCGKTTNLVWIHDHFEGGERGKMISLSEIADSFFAAFYEQKWRMPGEGFDISRLSVAQAYEIQHLVTQRRIASGERAVGYKVGCTSEAIREQFGFLDIPPTQYKRRGDL